jgi:sec-independent protein translocase protein TatA
MNALLLFLGGVGFQEIMVIGLFVLVFFGAKKIPEFMKGLGKGVKEFKEGVSSVQKDIEESTKITEPEIKKEIIINEKAADQNTITTNP